MSTVAVAVLITSLWPAGLFRDGPRIHVTSAAVTSGRLRGPIVLGGAARPTATVRVQPMVTAPLQSIDVAPHAFVRAGDVLAHLDGTAYRQPVASAETALENATDELNLQRERLDDLQRQSAQWGQRPSDVLPDRTEWAILWAALREAEGDVRVAEARALAAQDAVAHVSAEMQQPVILAPVSGWVASITTMPPRFEIAADLAHTEATVEVDGHQAGAVRVGDTAVVMAAACEARGTVSRIGQDQDGSLAVILDVAATVHDLPPGESVTVAFNGSRRQPVVRIPNAALDFTPTAAVLEAASEARVPEIRLVAPTGRPARVWVYDGSALAAIDVETGEHDDRFTELVAGPLRPGDRVVTAATVVAESRPQASH